MSSAPARNHGHRHTPSADSAKYDDPTPAPGGLLSAETVGAHNGQDYSQHPANSWGRFRLDIGTTRILSALQR